jgi:hypothetical protein
MITRERGVIDITMGGVKELKSLSNDEEFAQQWAHPSTSDVDVLRVLHSYELRRERPVTLFLSYAHEDMGRVSEFDQRLRDRGFDVLRDEMVILPGDVMVERIEKSIHSSDYALLFLSKASVNSKWVQHEYRLAQYKEIEEQRVFLIPVLLGQLDQGTMSLYAKAKKYVDAKRRDVTTCVEEISTGICRNIIDRDGFSGKAA